MSEYKAISHLSGHTKAINAFAFNSRGTRMVSGGDDGRVIIWNISKPTAPITMQMLTERFGRWGQITTLAFLTPAGSLGYPIDSIIFGTGRGYVCKYTEDKSGGRFEEVHGEAQFNDCPVEALASSGQIIIVTSHDGTIRGLDISQSNWAKLWELKLNDAIPRAVSFDLTGSTVHVFSLETGEQYSFAADTGKFKELKQLKGPVGAASLSPDGQRFLIDHIAGPFEIYAISTSSPASTLRVPAAISSSSMLVRPQGALRQNIIKQGVFAEDGKVAVCGSCDGRIFIYLLGSKSDGQNQILPAQILSHESQNAVQAVGTFSQPERHIIVSAPTEDKAQITIWARGRLVRDLPLESTLKELSPPMAKEPSPMPLPPPTVKESSAMPLPPPVVKEPSPMPLPPPVVKEPSPMPLPPPMLKELQPPALKELPLLVREPSTSTKKRTDVDRKVTEPQKEEKDTFGTLVLLTIVIALLMWYFGITLDDIIGTVVSSVRARFTDEGKDVGPDEAPDVIYMW